MVERSGQTKGGGATPPAKKFKHGTYLSVIFLLSAAVFFLVTERYFHEFLAETNLQLAVYSTSDLTQQYVNYYEANGQWPTPGSVSGNRGITYINTKYQTEGSQDRVDVFRLSRQHVINVSLRHSGTIYMRVEPIDP